MLLKDKNHSIPSGAFWKHPETGTMIYWTETKAWDTFFGEVKQFCAQNGFQAPTDEELQDIVCSQLGPGWCVGTPNFQQVGPTGRSGCQTCGGR